MTGLWDRMRRTGIILRTDVDGVPYATLRVPVADGWTAEYRLTVQFGRLVVAEVRVFPTDAVPPGGLTRRLLRAVPVAAHVDRAAEITRAYAAEMESAVVRISEDGKAAFRRLHGLVSAPRGRRASTSPDAKRPGRKPLRDEVLAVAAQAYVAARKAGARAPVPSAAKAGKMSEARMRDLIYRARQKGFLTKTMQGRGGGALTPEARVLLKAAARAKTTQRRLR